MYIYQEVLEIFLFYGEKEERLIVKKYRVIGIIPARFGSTRLSGKPIADIAGKPMVQWVVENACNAESLSEVIVATDDVRIYDSVKSFGGNVVMTPTEISSGTDRVAYAARNVDADIIVNIQCDEPFIRPDEIDSVARILIEDSEAKMGTLVKRMTDNSELNNKNIVKVVMDRAGNCLYFSRSPIPFFRDMDSDDWIKEFKYYKHIGIYSFRKDFLMEYSEWEVTPLESTERLEQLRVLENGYRIKAAETQYEHICVDSPQDLERARSLAERFKN